MEKQINTIGGQQNAFSSASKSYFVLAGALCLLMGAMFALEVGAINQYDQLADSSAGSKSSVTLAVVENPELVARVLENLLRNIIYSASVDYATPQSGMAQKRGLDLGISRGFSGSQAGKHLMGLSAASFANGPGR